MAPLHIDVLETDGMGVPLEDDDAVLASTTLPAAEVPTTPGFISLDLSGFGITVRDGDRLAIALRSGYDDTTGSPYLWEGAGSRNLYRDGKHYVRTTAYPDWTALEELQATVPDVGFATIVTTENAVVDCVFPTVLADDSNGIQI